MTRFSPRDLSRINLCGIVINFRTITSFGVVYGHFSTDNLICQEIFIGQNKDFSSQQGNEVDIAAITDMVKKPVDKRISANSEKTEHFCT